MCQSALLVIDVQRGLFQKSTPIYHTESLLDNILTLVNRAQTAGAPIIYVQHCANRDLVKGSEAWQLHPRLAPRHVDPLVYKEHGNAFEATPLREILTERRVVRLVVCGLVTHGCVKATCLGALALGYPLTLAADAHSSYSKKADQLITEWNAKLQAAGAVLQPTAEIAFD